MFTCTNALKMISFAAYLPPAQNSRQSAASLRILASAISLWRMPTACLYRKAIFSPCQNGDILFRISHSLKTTPVPVIIWKIFPIHPPTALPHMNLPLPLRSLPILSATARHRKVFLSPSGQSFCAKPFPLKVRNF